MCASPLEYTGNERHNCTTQRITIFCINDQIFYTKNLLCAKSKNDMFILKTIFYINDFLYIIFFIQKILFFELYMCTHICCAICIFTRPLVLSEFNPITLYNSTNKKNKSDFLYQKTFIYKIVYKIWNI